MPSRTPPRKLVSALVLILSACGNDNGTDNASATGGAPANGTGGAASSSGGAIATGGLNGSATGGNPIGSTGGASVTSGGTSGAGGNVAQGGTSSGGSSPGGNAATGGNTASGGATNSGGSASTGGSGAAGMSSTGGNGGATSSWHAATVASLTDQKLTDEYNAWKAAYAQNCNNGSWVVKKDAGSVVSEGIGYGMLLSANRGDRTLFDGLWKYYGDHLDPKGLMNWATGVCDAAGNNNANAATDGDLDVAMALIQANKVWPDGGYLALASALTAKIIQYETEECSGRAILRPGDMFGGCSDMSNAKINPSYFAPGYYRVFAHYFPAQAARWNALIDGSYELFPIYQARMAGLVPDWSKVDGGDWYGAGYSYDACRTPWRVMVDYAWTGDARALTFLKNVNTWVDAHGLVNGTQPNNSAFVGALALASAYDQAKFDAAVSTWLGSKGDDMPYFQGTLRVLYLLAAAGKFPSTL
ncbi:MAG TPA: glycosyl hydrolase family 8 [Polyangiaceae bacterium]|jgi:endo-1,4-beta-D-glucanase Y|nr:glycosyl hydrolase family 8 [Polyangiaceae bacterium]